MKKLLILLFSILILFCSNITLGAGYTSYETSRDGKEVCAGGRYTSYATSRDGKNVACGGRYTSYATSRDGKEVCAGGDVWWWDD